MFKNLIQNDSFGFDFRNHNEFQNLITVMDLVCNGNDKNDWENDINF